MAADNQYRVGIDIGGTFTDLCVLNAESGEWFGLKTPTTPTDLVQGVLDGLQLVAAHGVDLSRVRYFVHGTTSGLNTIIQRSGARVALLVTEGFRDLMEIGRLRLPVPWNFYSQRAQALVPRHMVIPVRERIVHGGIVEVPLTASETAQVIQAVRLSGAAEVAICLLHSYANPSHEEALKTAIEKSGLQVGISCSAELWPQMREYERAMVTVMNAHIRPAMARYFDNLGAALTAAGLATSPYITRSNGGIMTVSAAKDEPVQTLLSGPASGIIGAAKVAQDAGFQNFVTLDVGGTSADVAVVRNGEIEYGTDERIGDYPLILPAVGVSSIGAGGGSVAWIDGGRALRVGPRSAGAVPGPASYGLGGNEATLTDAFLISGFLDPDCFAGDGHLNTGAAVAALAALADKLDMSHQEASDSVVRVALANMYTELSAVLERRGVDPRDYAIVAFGGAGPVVACMLAGELNIPTVVVPASPGTLCAQGALQADVMADFIRSVYSSVDKVASAEFYKTVQQLTQRARAWLDREAPTVKSSEVQYAADMRYAGQSYEIQIPLPAAWLSEQRANLIRRAFDDAHQRIYAHCDHHAPVEIVNLRARAVGRMEQPAYRPMPRRQAEPQSAARRVAASRAIWIDGRSYPARVIDRGDLSSEADIVGPAVVQQSDSTCVVPPKWRGRLDDSGNLILTRHQTAEGLAR